METDSDILLMAGDSILRIEDVVNQIPPGLSAADSIALFENIVDTWAHSMVLMDVARENIDNDKEIERMVSEYRNHLILNAYMKEMATQSVPKVSEEEKKKYYEQHKDEFILETPVVKGIYLKVPESVPRIADLRTWMTSGNRKSIENIERYGLAQALQYEYFADKWMPWNKLSAQIPYRFFDADAFLQSTHDFETTYGGSVYFLHIYDYLPSGSTMPYDIAEEEIRHALEFEKGDKYMIRLIEELMQRAIEKGSLKVGSYDLFKQKNNQRRV